jgi:hypothetical protein
MVSGWPQLLMATISSVMLGDVDADAELEIVALTFAGQIHILEADGTTGAGAPALTVPGSSLAALANVDGDAELEIVTFHANEVLAVNPDGVVGPDWPVVVQGIIKRVGLDDIDGDGDLEMLVNVLDADGSGSTGVLHLFDLGVSSASHGWLLEHRDRTNSRRHPSLAASVSTPSGPKAPPSFVFRAPRPNPTESDVLLEWLLPRSTRVRLQVFNVRGELLKTIVDEHLGPGEHTARWDGRDRRGRVVASGVYFARLEAPPFSSVKRFVEFRR